MMNTRVILFLFTAVVAAGNLAQATPHASDGPVKSEEGKDTAKPQAKAAAVPKARASAPDYNHFVCTDETKKFTVALALNSIKGMTELNINGASLQGDRLSIDRNGHIVEATGTLIPGDMKRVVTLRIDASQATQKTELKWADVGKGHVGAFLPPKVALTCQGNLLRSSAIKPAAQPGRAPLIDPASPLGTLIRESGGDPMSENVQTLNKERVKEGKAPLIIPGTKLGKLVRENGGSPMSENIQKLNDERAAAPTN